MAAGPRRTDTPVVHATAASLRSDDDDDLEDFVLALSSGTRVVFPHLGRMDFEEAETIARMLQQSTTPALRRWLDKDDYRAVQAEKFSLLEMGRLARLIGLHFSDALAELGVDIRGDGDDVEFEDFDDD